MHESGLDLDGFSEDFMHDFFLGPVLEFIEEKYPEFRVHPLVSGDKLVGFNESLKLVVVRQVENEAERSAEEYSFHDDVDQEFCAEGCVVCPNPFFSPRFYLIEDRKCVYSVPDLLFFFVVCDIRLYQERIHVGVYVLDSHLPPVVVFSLDDLDLVHQTIGDVEVNDPVELREEGEYHFDERFLVIGECIKVVLTEVNLFRKPYTRSLFVEEFP